MTDINLLQTEPALLNACQLMILSYYFFVVLIVTKYRTQKGILIKHVSIGPQMLWYDQESRELSHCHAYTTTTRELLLITFL